MIAKGTEQDKLHFFFTLYDLDGQGAVSKDELRMMLTFVPEGIIALAAQQQSKARSMVRSFAFKTGDDGSGDVGDSGLVAAAAAAAAAAATATTTTTEDVCSSISEHAATSLPTTTSTAPSIDLGMEADDERTGEEEEENFSRGASPEFVAGMVEDAFEQCDLNRDGR